MKLILKQRFFSWTDTYDVFDEDDCVKYFVKAEFFSLGHVIHVYDTTGKEVALVGDAGRFDEAANPTRFLSGMHIWFSTADLQSQLYALWRIHSDRTNLSFLDGHVETLTAQQMYDMPMKITFSYSKDGKSVKKF